MRHHVISRSLTFEASDGALLPAYFSCPASEDRVPGILFIYEALGMNDEMRRLADSFAAHGFAVMIPDLFARGPWALCITRLLSDLKRESGQGVADLLAARTWLAQQSQVDSARMAVLGLCMGGGFALLLAKTGLFKVAAPFYGHMPRDLAGACPIVGSYGAKDQAFLPHFKRLEAEVAARQIPADLKLYPEAGHSFMNSMPNNVVSWLGEHLPMNTGHHVASEIDARRRVVEFLRQHL